MRRWLIPAAALLTLVTIAPQPAAAGPGDAAARKLDKYLQVNLQKGDQGAQRVIVQAAPGAGQAVGDAARKNGRWADQGHCI